MVDPETQTDREQRQNGMMLQLPYDVGPIRPPSEAGSLLIRVNRNCPWNKCAFCIVYKQDRYERKSVDDVKSDIDFAATSYGERRSAVRKAFLQDADALLMKTAELVEVISYMKEKFPSLSRITTYARTPTLAGKSVEDLRALKDAGLSRVHTGLETGHGPLLKLMSKGTNPQQQIEAGVKVKEAGLSLSEYVMPGLGGREYSKEHAVDTAMVLNAIDADFVRLRTTSIQPDTPMWKMVESGKITPMTDFEIVEEIRLFIENLEGISSAVVSDHMLNLLMEVRGQLPGDKQRMLDTIDRFHELSDNEKRIFQVGTRFGMIRCLEHMDDLIPRAEAEKLLSEIEKECSRSGDGFTVDDYIREAMFGRM